MNNTVQQKNKDLTSAANVALVIGGSRGIGAAVCRELITGGCRVAWTHRGSEAGKKETIKLHTMAKKHGCQTIDAVVDCTDPDGTADFIETIMHNWGRIDYLVYCAGFTSPVSFLDLTSEEWRKIVDLNLNGAFIAAHAVMPYMIKERNGSIVLIGSAAVTSGGGGRADYISAKAGLEGLNLAITKEFAPQGVRCNLVHPSLIETDLLCTRYPDEAVRNEMAMGVPVRRLGQPEDIAHLVMFLLSDKAGYITGQSILVDGGRSYCK